jgi:hypothetical protein
MSVVAKMYSYALPRRFPEVQQVDLQCVCDDRLFTIESAQTPADRVSENQTFSQASPQGDCRFQLPIAEPIGLNEEFYLVFIEQPDCPTFDKALAVSKVRCMSVTDFGGTSRQVDVSSDHRPYDYARRSHPDDDHPRQIWSFTMRMNIDNPAAAIQFKPGGDTYWVGIYRAREHDLHDALADAHSDETAARFFTGPKTSTAAEE